MYNYSFQGTSTVFFNHQSDTFTIEKGSEGSSYHSIYGHDIINDIMAIAHCIVCKCMLHLMWFNDTSHHVARTSLPRTESIFSDYDFRQISNATDYLAIMTRLYY